MKINILFRLLTVPCPKLIKSIMSKGTVKFYNEFKGFGFIKEEKTSKDYFVHSSGLKEKIRDNDLVIFDLEPGKKGMQAVNVKLA